MDPKFADLNDARDCTQEMRWRGKLRPPRQRVGLTLYFLPRQAAGSTLKKPLDTKQARSRHETGL